MEKKQQHIFKSSNKSNFNKQTHTLKRLPEKKLLKENNNNKKKPT